MRLNLDGPDTTARHGLAPDAPLPPDHDRVAPDQKTIPAAGFLAGLYRAHSTRLRRYFAGRGSPAQADDLVQETFVRMAGTQARKPANLEQPRAYMNRVANNLLREQARFAARRSAALHVNEADFELSGPDPVAQLEARDMLARLEAAMAHMKPATREIFMAHRIHGYSYAEIADSMGRSPKSVEKHMAKAIFLINRFMRAC